VTLKNGEGEFLRYLSQTLSPPRLAGTFILLQDKAGLGDSGRAAWLYTPGLKRLRRAPTVQYDNPYEGTDGNQFYDQVEHVQRRPRPLQLENWSARRSCTCRTTPTASPQHGEVPRPDPAAPSQPGPAALRTAPLLGGRGRGEAFGQPHLQAAAFLHRTRTAGTSRRWTATDNKDQLYKFQEGHLVTTPSVQAATTVPEVIYDLASGRYIVTAAFNEDRLTTWR